MSVMSAKVLDLFGKRGGGGGLEEVKMKKREVDLRFKGAIFNRDEPMVEGLLVVFMVLALVLTSSDVEGFINRHQLTRAPQEVLRASSSAMTSASTEDLGAAAVAYAAENGILMRSKVEEGGFDVAPFSLLPQKFPRSEFDRAVSMASSMNKVVEAVSRGESFSLVSFRFIVWIIARADVVCVRARARVCVCVLVGGLWAAD